MPRYNEEARITFNGDRALAARYVSEGRKYLGGLMATSPQQTAVRELTNPDGVHFRVGYFGGVPFIEITAEKTVPKAYRVATVGGYLLAPRTFASLTAYASQPFVLVNPSSGNEALWPSYFSAIPAPPLTGSTHPTSAYVDGAKTIKDVVATLSANAAISLPNIETAAMSWNNRDESLFLHWSGASYTQNTFNTGSTSVYHNAKKVCDFNAFFVGVREMLLGVGAKRTNTGLDLYATVAIADTHFGPYRVAVIKARLEPTDSEKTRLAPYKDVMPNAFSYAAEMQDAGETAEIASYAFGPKLNFQTWGAIVFNQSCTEARGFVYTYDGTTNLVKELIIDVSDDEAVTIDDTTNVVAVSVSTGLVVTYSPTAKDCRYKDVGYAVGVPGLPGYPSGVYPDGPITMTQDDPFYGVKNATTAFSQQIGTAPPDGVFIADWINSEQITTPSVAEIKNFCDYIDDVPVYGYSILGSGYTETLTRQLDYQVSTSQSVSVTGTISGGGTAWGGSSQYNEKTISGTSENDASDTVADVRSGVKIPKYDVDGNEDGFWLNVAGYRNISTGSSESVALSHTTITATAGNSTVGSYTYGRAASAVEERVTLSLSYLNLRTKSAAYSLEKVNSSDSSASSATGTSATVTGFNTSTSGSTASSSSFKRKQVIVADEVVILDSAYADYIAPGSSSSSPSGTGTANIAFTGQLTRYHYSGGAPTTIPDTYAAAIDPASYFAGVPESSYTYDHTTPYSITVAAFNNVAPFTIGALLPGYSFAPSFAGFPAKSVSMQTRLSSALVAWGFVTAPGASDKFNFASNNAIGYKGTLDYITGAHAAPYYSAVYNISAIAVKIQTN